MFDYRSANPFYRLSGRACCLQTAVTDGVLFYLLFVSVLLCTTGCPIIIILTVVMGAQNLRCSYMLVSLLARKTDYGIQSRRFTITTDDK